VEHFKSQIRFYN